MVVPLTLASCGSEPPPPTVEGAWVSLGYDLASTYHNPHERAISTETAPNLRESWRITVTGNVTGAPAVVGNRVYVVASTRTMAFDLATGEEIWRAPRPAVGTAAPAYEDGVLYVVGSNATINALNAENGELLWSTVINEHPNAAGYSSPIVADQYVLVGDSSGEEAATASGATFRGAVVAYNKTDGSLAWRHDTVEEPHNGVAVWSTVSVDLEDRVVFASTGNNYTEEASDTSDAIFAIELDSGDLVWKNQVTTGDVFTILNSRGNPDHDFGANPILFEAEVEGTMRKLVGTGQKSGTFWVMDRATGDVVWSRELSGGTALLGGMLNNGAYDGERILVASNTATSSAPGSEPANRGNTSVLFALDPANGDILWERQLPDAVWAPITVANGVGFVAADKQLQAFDTATGAKLMTFDTDGTIACGASISNGRVLFGSGMQYISGTNNNDFHVLSLP